MIFVALSIMTQDVQNSSENIFLTQIKTGDPNMLVVDESLETRTALACELLVTLDSDSIQLALKEKKSNRILALESFQLNQGNKGINWTDALEQLSRNSHLLRNFEFTKAIVGVFSPAYTLVPDAIYKAGDDKKFLDFHFEDKEKTRKIFSRQVNPFQLKTIFGISEELHHELFHLFEEPELIHPASTLLEAAHLQSRGKKEKELFINVRRGNVDIIVLEGKKLMLMNSFISPTADDLLYFSLMVCDQLELDPDSIQVWLSGEVEKESAKYKLLFKYFRNLQFSERPGNVSYSYRIEQLPKHQHFSLFSLALCEL